MIKALSIHGFRGFGEKQTLTFSLPDGRTVGRGLNIITGANNTGKTTIIESIRAFNGSQEPTFSEGMMLGIKKNGVLLKKQELQMKREFLKMNIVNMLKT